MKTSKCYVCGSNKSRILWVKNGYRINRCVICNFVFVSNLPTKVTLNKFYQNFDYHNPEIAERVIRHDAKNSIRKILRFKTHRANMLDVGCGRGFFLDEAKKIGFDVYGIDSSKSVIKYAQEILGLNVVNNDIMSYKPNRKFSIIVLNQVIEHFSKPLDLINKCASLLESKGLIYIATPNINSISAKISKEKFNYLCPPEHLGYFNNETLPMLLHANALRPLYTGSWGYSEDLAGIIKNLLKSNSIGNGKGLLKETKKPIMSINKRVKFILFDIFFCKIFFRLLNIHGMGSNLEVIAVKD